MPPSSTRGTRPIRSSRPSPRPRRMAARRRSKPTAPANGWVANAARSSGFRSTDKAYYNAQMTGYSSIQCYLDCCHSMFSNQPRIAHAVEIGDFSLYYIAISKNPSTYTTPISKVGMLERLQSTLYLHLAHHANLQEARSAGQ